MIPKKNNKKLESWWGLESWFEAWGKIEGLESLNQACNAVSLFISFLQIYIFGINIDLVDDSLLNS